MPSPSPSLLTLFHAWATLHAYLNDEATPETEARGLYERHDELKAALVATPAATRDDLAAEVLALTEHGTLELPETLVDECQEIVKTAVAPEAPEAGSA